MYSFSSAFLTFDIYLGDQLSTPFELKLTKELPTVKQKTEVIRRSMKKASSENGDQPDIMSKFRLPTDIVTKIYDKLHHDAEVCTINVCHMGQRHGPGFSGHLNQGEPEFVICRKNLL